MIDSKTEGEVPEVDGDLDEDNAIFNSSVPDSGGSLVDLVVSEEQAGARLDRYLADSLPDLSRSRVQALLRADCVRMGSGRVVTDASGRVKMGERYSVAVPPPEAAVPEAQNIPLDVVFEDQHLIVVNKPAGMVVHPAPGNWDGTLVNALLHHCGESLQGIGGVLRPGIVHRIDKDTSGLLVVAKSDKTHAGLAALFAAHDIDRRYRALVIGVLIHCAVRLIRILAAIQPTGCVSRLLARIPANRQLRIIVSWGRRIYRSVWWNAPWKLAEPTRSAST